MQTTNNCAKRHGFTIVELMIVVFILSLLAIIAWPNFLRSRATAQSKACINNLRQIDGAKIRWAFDNRKTETEIPALTDLVPYMHHDTPITCPADGTYRPRRVVRPPLCSYYSDGHVLSQLSPDDNPAED